jgi:hypothetical protein
MFLQRDVGRRLIAATLPVPADEPEQTAREKGCQADSEVES